MAYFKIDSPPIFVTDFVTNPIFQPLFAGVRNRKNRHFGSLVLASKSGIRRPMLLSTELRALVSSCINSLNEDWLALLNNTSDAWSYNGNSVYPDGGAGRILHQIV